MIGWIHTETHRLIGEIYEIAVEMGSGAMIYIPNFIKIGSGINRLIRGIHIESDSMVIA
jgi:uncharacterized RmlC-like cupin family protein